VSEKLKKILWGVFAMVLVAVAAVWFITDDLKPIEDTNGPDDPTLTTITDENITKLDMGALNPIQISASGLTVGNLNVSNFTRFSSENFTGVYEVLYDNFILPSDFMLSLSSFTVTSGNFKMAVVHDGQIVATLEPGESVEYLLRDVTGTVSLRIAGESAAYEFFMAPHDYDLHTHP